MRVTGKAVGGIERIIEVEDDGTDTVHVVPRTGLCAGRTRRRIDLARSSATTVGHRHRPPGSRGRRPFWDAASGGEAICPTVITLEADSGAEAVAFEPVVMAVEALVPRVEVARPGLLFRTGGRGRPLLRRRGPLADRVSRRSKGWPATVGASASPMGPSPLTLLRGVPTTDRWSWSIRWRSSIPSMWRRSGR